jgi:hypothetical protein
MLLPAQFSGIRVRQVVPNCTQVLYFPPSHHLQPCFPPWPSGSRGTRCCAPSAHKLARHAKRSPPPLLTPDSKPRRHGEPPWVGRAARRLHCTALHCACQEPRSPCPQNLRTRQGRRVALLRRTGTETRHARCTSRFVSALLFHAPQLSIDVGWFLVMHHFWDMWLRDPTQHQPHPPRASLSFSQLVRDQP